MSEELGTPLYYTHTLTARGLVSRDFARRASQGHEHIIAWSRGQAGIEMYYEGVRYVPAHAREDIPALLAALDARDAEIARLRGEIERLTTIVPMLERRGETNPEMEISIGTWWEPVPGAGLTFKPLLLYRLADFAAARRALDPPDD